MIMAIHNTIENLKLIFRVSPMGDADWPWACIGFGDTQSHAGSDTDRRW